MSKFCPKCGTKLRDGASFCVKCGYKLTENQLKDTEKKAEIEIPKNNNEIQKEIDEELKDLQESIADSSEDPVLNPVQGQEPDKENPETEPEKPDNSDKTEEKPDDQFQYCPSCGAQIKKGSAFCPKCGHSFSGAVERKSDKKGSESPGGTTKLSDNTGSNKSMIIVLCIVIAALLLGGGGYFYFTKMAPKLNYQKAVKLIDEHKYDEAYSILEKLGDYEDAKYLLSTLSVEYDLGNESGLRLMKNYSCDYMGNGSMVFYNADKRINTYISSARQYGTNSGYDLQYKYGQYNFQVKMTGSDVLLIRSSPSTNKAYVYTKSNGKNIYWPNGGVFTVTDIYADDAGYVWYKMDLFGGSSKNDSLFEEVNGISLSKMKSIVGSRETWGCDHYVNSSGKSREYFTELDDTIVYIPEGLNVSELKNRLTRFFAQDIYSDVKITEKDDRVIVSCKVESADIYNTYVYFIGYRGLECTRFTCSISEMNEMKTTFNEFAEKLILYR